MLKVLQIHIMILCVFGKDTKSCLKNDFFQKILMIVLVLGKCFSVKCHIDHYGGRFLTMTQSVGLGWPGRACMLAFPSFTKSNLIIQQELHKYVLWSDEERTTAKYDYFTNVNGRGDIETPNFSGDGTCQNHE